MPAPTKHLTLIPTVTIAAAKSGQLSEVHRMPAGVRALGVQANFAYGADGTSVKVWVQTSLDGGVTWIDIMCFAFTTAAARKVSAVNTAIALAAATTPSDGALADNTIVNGVIGDLVRVMWTSTGTYAGATSLTVTAVPHGA